MYSFSHRPNQDWLGEFHTPAEALAAGRRQYGGDTKIFVGRWTRAYYADSFIGADALLSYMKEAVSDELGDQYADIFDALSPAQIKDLDSRIRDAIGEWESELPEAAAFTGHRIHRVVGYAELEEVRQRDFS